MRKVESIAAGALLHNRSMPERSNTCVRVDRHMRRLLLHGNDILIWDTANQRLHISLCGYNTVTTRSRLNNICKDLHFPFRCMQKNYKLYVKYVCEDGDFHNWHEADDEDIFFVAVSHDNAQWIG